jgi:hypothetical protein
MPVRERTRSLVRKTKSTRVSHHRYAETSGIPCAMVLAAYGALSPVSGLVSHRPRAMRKHCRELIPASGDQDHTISPHALAAPVTRNRKRPSHPAPNVRDDRDTSLFSGARRAGF